MENINSKKYLSLKDYDEEIWKDVKGWEGYYKVSNMGRVKAVNRKIITSNGKTYIYPERILKAHITKSGYVNVCLSRGGNYYTKRLHQVVISAFYERPIGLNSVNHKDEDKTNNRLDNLEYCTVLYNNTYASRAIRVAKSQMNDPNRSVKVCQYTKDGVLVFVFPSIKEAMRQTGADVRRISACCNGYRKTEKGFVWAYEKDGFDGQKKKYRKYLDELIVKDKRKNRLASERIRLEMQKLTLF